MSKGVVGAMTFDKLYVDVKNVRTCKGDGQKDILNRDVALPCSNNCIYARVKL